MVAGFLLYIFYSERVQYTTGELFPELNEMFPDLGELFPELGEMFPELGEMFPELGEMFPELGEMFTANWARCTLGSTLLVTLLSPVILPHNAVLYNIICTGHQF